VKDGKKKLISVSEREKKKKKRKKREENKVFVNECGGYHLIASSSRHSSLDAAALLNLP
jgi:hypothetical protein